MSLAVCTVYANPMRWNSRLRNYTNFQNRMIAAGVKLYVADISYDLYGYDVNSDYNITVRYFNSGSTMWHKENALNLLLRDVQETNVAWLDADIAFTRPDWVEETECLLENYKMVQMFSHAINLNQYHEPEDAGHDGYIKQWFDSGKHIQPVGDIRTGLAWAASKETLIEMGKLMDFCIVGGADHHMIAGLIGETHKSFNWMEREYALLNYTKKIHEWVENARKVVKPNKIGYMQGTVLHYYHGSHELRGYKTRHNILADNKFDPYRDIDKDIQGLYYFVESSKKRELQADIINFMHSRNEDYILQPLTPPDMP